MPKGKLDIDSRGLIHESYRIEGITAAECRSIFLDWAMGQDAGVDMKAALRRLQAEYAKGAPDHPMTALIAEGLARDALANGRRRRRGRVK